jgi:hypothetical protein
MRVKGEKAAADMKVLRWDDTAARFHALALDVKTGKYEDTKSLQAIR